MKPSPTGRVQFPSTDVASGRKVVLDSLLLGMGNVSEGKMFGHAAYYVKGKLFACLLGNGLGVKVPENVAHRLLRQKHIDSFRPYGKPRMREWIQINRSRPSEYGKDVNTFRISIAFVGQSQITKRIRQSCKNE